MANKTNQRRSLLLLWLMATTNSDAFDGQGVGGSVDDVLANKNIKGIKGIDEVKKEIVERLLSKKYYRTFATVREIYLQYSQTTPFWAASTDGPGPVHPPLSELERTFFRKPVPERPSKVAKTKKK